MTWGSTTQSIGDYCRRCKHQRTCRNACRTLTPVCCEDRQPKAAAVPPEQRIRLCDLYMAAVMDGHAFTAKELADLFDVSSSSVSSWCSQQVRRGILVHTGYVPVEGGVGAGGRANVYRYVGFAPSGDGVTWQVDLSPYGTEHVAPPLDGTRQT